MEKKSYPFSELPFSTLFNDYIRQEEPISEFFETPPFDREEIINRAESFHFNGDREAIAGELRSINESHGAPRETLDNIEKLRQPDSLVVVTGQQLTLYGGPVFTVLKTLSAIALSKQYEKLLKRPVVPVFWLADEDHDAEEISSIGIPARDELKRCTASPLETEKRVAELPLEPFIESFRSCVENELPDTDFSPGLMKLLDRCYAPSKTVGRAFGELMLALFGKHGLVLAGSSSDRLKEMGKNCLKRSVTDRGAIYDRLSETTQQLESNGYPGQVHLQQSNLFYINDQSDRVKVQYEEGRWYTEGPDSKEWSDESLVKQIDQTPGRFSPNVFLRPIFQDTLLPVISYVAGPGEIAYYAQMKQVYPLFNLTMPQISPRFSATVIESGVERILDKLPFSIGEYSKRIEDLESEFIDQSGKPDLEKIFADWKKSVDEITEAKKKVIGEIDPTLENSAGKASATYFSELDKLKGKMYRSLKQQEQTQLDRIAKIKANLFPAGNLQEREVAFIHFMNKYGMEVWDQLLRELQDEDPDSHKLIYL